MTIDYREIHEGKKERLAKRVAMKRKRGETMGCLVEAVMIMGIVMLAATLTYVALWGGRA